MNLNLKMTVERSKRRSHFLSLVFITKCFSKNLLQCNMADNKQGSCGRSCKAWKSPRTGKSPGKRLLVLESFRNVLNASKKYEMYGRQ